MPKPVFKPCGQHQLTLLPPDLSDLIEPEHMVRVVDSVIDSIDTSELYALYPGGGTSAYGPKMLLKAIVFAYASAIYSSRKIERATKESIRFMWLTGLQPLDHMTVNRFRSERIRPVFESMFASVVELLAKKGLVSLETYFLDGAKIEANANKYTFVWKKSIEANRSKLQDKVRRHLDGIDRINEEEGRIAASLPAPEEVSAEDIAEAARRINERLRARPKDKELKRANKAFQDDYLPRMKRYEDQTSLFEERRSFSKTDIDATFMRMKEDRMQNGQLKAGYNVQISAENRIVLAYTLHRRAGDTACLIDHVKHAHRLLGSYPHVLGADAGYGSEESYEYLESKDIRAFAKHNMFHKEQKRSFKKDPIQPKNWNFDQVQDVWTCAQGRHLRFLGEKKAKSDLGYVSTTRLCKCKDCSGCASQQACTKSSDEARNRVICVNPRLESLRERASRRLASPEGVDIRRRRATDVETVFGNIKNNFGFKRFSLRGLDKVTHEWGLVAMGHNIRKIYQAFLDGNVRMNLAGA